MSGRRVLVTGATRGIGRAIALRLGREGWQVAIHGSASVAEAESLAVELGDQASGVYLHDLSRPETMGELFGRVVADGPVHALVNNAGIYRPQSFLTEDEVAFHENLTATFAINLYSPIELMRRFGTYFAAEGGGKILNVASRAGLRGENGASIYAASKAALVNFSRSLSMELAPQKVGVFCLTPGWVDTSMARDGMGERLTEILATIPLGRMATPEDCASAAAFLLGEDASYLSGITLDINGASYFH